MKNKLSKDAIAKCLIFPRRVKTNDAINEMINASIKEGTLHMPEQMKILSDEDPMVRVVSLLADAVIARIVCKSTIENAKRKQINT